jgi:hypothetical protein
MVSATTQKEWMRRYEPMKMKVENKLVLPSCNKSVARKKEEKYGGDDEPTKAHRERKGTSTFGGDGGFITNVVDLTKRENIHKHGKKSSR